MIKVVIFDFDKTIYVGNIGDDDNTIDKLCVDKSFGEGVYNNLVKKYNINKCDIKDIIELCRREGMDYKKLAKVFADNIFIHNIKSEIEVLPNEFFKKLSNNYNIYIASMSQKKYIQYYLSLYNIDKTCFKDFLYLDLVRHTSKADLFKIVIEKERCKPEEILVIGDSFVRDIQPALECNMNALHFCGEFSQIYNFLTKNDICECEEFKNNKKFIKNEKL